MAKKTIVTEEDYLQYYGIKLSVILNGAIINNLGDNPAPRFIYDVEQWCIRRFKTPPYHWNGDTTAFTNQQLIDFKDGVIQQIWYVISKGKPAQYTFNQETGFIIPQGEMNRIGLNPDSFDCFRLCGIANLMKR